MYTSHGSATGTRSDARDRPRSREVIEVFAYQPGGSGPGRLSRVPLELVERGANQLALPGVTVRDERSAVLLDPAGQGDLLADPVSGGGPRSSSEEELHARLFGLTNTAYHAQRVLRTMAELLDHPLPPLTIRIGMHEDVRRWGGGHYRVAARTYDPPESRQPSVTGEVHLGGGRDYLRDARGGPYFGAPSHNLAIIYHEIGHHVCRHTADFRLNRLRRENAQTNKKIALDEGTADYITAIMLDDPDIYGWHRAEQPNWSRRRRALSRRWTMAMFEGGAADPHADGMIWSSACWTARARVASAGYEPSRFDRMLLRGLEISAERNSPVDPGTACGLTDAQLAEDRTRVVLKRRRYFSALLEALLEADPELSDPILAGMAEHGIRPGHSNVALRRGAGGIDREAVGIPARGSD